MNGLSRASDASFVGAFSSRGDAAPRAPAVLRELSLIKCPKITDDAVSIANKLEGTVFEMLGTAFSVGCTVNGEAPMDILASIKAGDLEIPDE